MVSLFRAIPMELKKMEYNKNTDMTAMFTEWSKSITDMWGNMAKTQTGLFGPFGLSEKMQKGPAYQAQKAYETGTKIFQSVISGLSEPENLSEMMKGMDSLPEFMMQMVQQSCESYLEMQKRWSERMIKMGQHTEAYQFEGVDQNIFNAWNEIYEKEFRKFLNVPQLGLTRFQQERVNRFVDKFNLFQAALNEFLYMFYIPIEKSSAVMQEKIQELAEKGEVHSNFKDYYNMWIRILEGHYMTLLKSPEYTQVMNNTIDALVQYREAKEELLYDIIGNLPIPTNRDMDELYKDFYLLKKKVKALSKELENLKN